MGSEQKNVPNITTILNEAPPMPVTDATNEVCEQDYFQNEDDFTNVVHEVIFGLVMVDGCWSFQSSSLVWSIVEQSE